MHTSIDQTLHCLWVDLELTGLETGHRAGYHDVVDDIVEFGIIGTNLALEPLYRQTIVVRTSEAGIARIESNPIVHEMMTDNGLLAELKAGREHGSLLTISEAEDAILGAMHQFAWRPEGTVILAGSGILHCDLRFLQLHTPRLAATFDDRERLDVGIERRRYQRVTGRNLTEANNGKNHRADVDIECHRQEQLCFDALYTAHALAGTNV